MSSTMFANTDAGADALRQTIIDHINSDPKLVESSREQRRRNAGVIIHAARLLLTADAEHGAHVWFSPEVLRALAYQLVQDDAVLVLQMAHGNGHRPVVLQCDLHWAITTLCGGTKLTTRGLQPKSFSSDRSGAFLRSHNL